jgi:hypothetical protein
MNQLLLQTFSETYDHLHHSVGDSSVWWVRWWTHFLHTFRLSQNRGFILENVIYINIVRWQNQIQICQWHFTYCIFEHNGTNVKKLFSFYKQIEWHDNFSEDSSSQQHYAINFKVWQTHFWKNYLQNYEWNVASGGRMWNTASACEFADITRASTVYWNILIWICRALRYLMAMKMLDANRYNTIYLYWLSLCDVLSMIEPL